MAVSKALPVAMRYIRGYRVIAFGTVYVPYSCMTALTVRRGLMRQKSGRH